MRASHYILAVEAMRAGKLAADSGRTAEALRLYREASGFAAQSEADAAPKLRTTVDKVLAFLSAPPLAKTTPEAEPNWGEAAEAMNAAFNARRVP